MGPRDGRRLGESKEAAGAFPHACQDQRPTGCLKLTPRLLVASFFSHRNRALLAFQTQWDCKPVLLHFRPFYLTSLDISPPKSNRPPTHYCQSSTRHGASFPLLLKSHASPTSIVTPTLPEPLPCTPSGSPLLDCKVSWIEKNPIHKLMFASIHILHTTSELMLQQ